MKYLMAYTIPLMALIGIRLGGMFTFTALIYAFLFIPTMEIVMQKSSKNPEEDDAETGQNKFIYDLMLYLNLPLVYVILIYAINNVATNNLSTLEIIGCTFSVGVMLGANGINVAHELGHRTKMFEKSIAKLLLIPSYYAHFYIEHNHGHHLNVATPDDASTARLNQNLYGFWFQSVVGTYKKAWQIQFKINRDAGKKFLNFQNDMLWLSLFQLMFPILIYLIFGLQGLMFSIFTGIVGFLLLETINYIEHYGLLRNKNKSGRYERVTEQHSWNSNHTLGRLILYELTRHSDHHAKSTKKYQTLENKQTSPQLAYGYPTSMVIAFFPPLWFTIMNKRVPNQIQN